MGLIWCELEGGGHAGAHPRERAAPPGHFVYMKQSALWEGWNNPAVTNAGHSTLASALWHSIDQNDPAGEYVITVKGEPMTSERAYQIIEKDLSKSVLSYALPAYARALSV